MASRELGKEIIETVGVENAKEVRTENIENVEKKKDEEKCRNDSYGLQHCAAVEGTVNRGAEVCDDENCFTWNAFSNHLENVFELETGSVLHENVNLVLADPPLRTRSVRRQLSSDYDVMWKKNKKNETRLVGSVKAPGAHGRTFCTYVVFVTERGT